MIFIYPYLEQQKIKSWIEKYTYWVVRQIVLTSVWEKPINVIRLKQKQQKQLSFRHNRH